MLLSGYCPIQQGNYSINVSYLDASTNDEKQYVKGSFSCTYNMHANKCNGNNCPIYKNAPKYKR